MFKETGNRAVLRLRITTVTPLAQRASAFALEVMAFGHGAN